MNITIAYVYYGYLTHVHNYLIRLLYLSANDIRGCGTVCLTVV